MSAGVAAHGPTDRAFGLTLATVGTVLGTFPLLRGGHLRPAFLAAAGTLAGLALIAPKILHYPKVGWIRLTMFIGKGAAQVIAGIAFFLVLSPLAIVLRLTGRDTLHRRARAGESMWVDRRNAKITLDNVY